MAAIRRLAAILAADVAGYSRLMGVDEGGTLRALKAVRGELVDPKITEHNGRLVKTTGDGLLVEFSSVVDALRCATEVQGGIVERNAALPMDSRIEFRIGINVGDVVGWRHLWRRRQRRSTPRGLGRARRHLRFSARAGGCLRQARSRLRGYGRAAAQEHRSAGASVPGS